MIVRPFVASAAKLRGHHQDRVRPVLAVGTRCKIDGVAGINAGVLPMPPHLECRRWIVRVVDDRRLQIIERRVTPGQVQRSQIVRRPATEWKSRGQRNTLIRDSIR